MKRQRTRKGAPGIVDVAIRSGVSPATVSRFYNKPDVVKGPTRKRIENAANELGYIRNRMAGSLHSQFSGTIGLIVPTIDNSIFAELIQAFALRLREQDRTMLIASHGYDLSQEIGIIRSLLERRIDGIVLVGLDHNDVPLNMLAQRDVPVITIWNYKKEGHLPCIGADNIEAGRAVTQHVLELGHEDIVFLFPDTSSNDRARDRMVGVIDALNQKGITLSQDRIYNCPYDIGSAKQITLEILKSRKPSAFVCGNDIIAHGVIYGCQAKGMSVPEDISVVGVGDFRGSAHMEPSLTTIRLPAKQIGDLAASAIIKMSETGLPPEPRHNKIEMKLMKRNSTQRMKKN